MVSHIIRNSQIDRPRSLLLLTIMNWKDLCSMCQYWAWLNHISLSSFPFFLSFFLPPSPLLSLSYLFPFNSFLSFFFPSSIPPTLFPPFTFPFLVCSSLYHLLYLFLSYSKDYAIHYVFFQFWSSRFNAISLIEGTLSKVDVQSPLLFF